MLSLVLVFVLIILLFISYYSNGRILSCSFIMISMFLISTGLYVVLLKPIVGDISLVTLFVIATSNLMVLLGEALAQNGRVVICRRESNESPNSVIDVSNVKTVIFVLIVGVALLLKVSFMRRLARQYGLSGLSSTTSLLRGSFVDGTISIPVYIQFLSGVSEAIAYVFAFLFLYYFMIKKRKRLLLSLPVVEYLLMQIFSTGRSGFIVFAIVVFCEFGFLLALEEKITSRRLSGKFFKYTIIIVLALSVVFYLYGNVIRSASHTMIEYLTEYVAAPILGLDCYLENPWPRNQQIMQYIFQNYYYYINKFGGNYTIPSEHLPFFEFGNMSSNIYTSLVFPIQDMGVIGMLLSRMLIGVVFSTLTYTAINKKSGHGRSYMFCVIMTSYLMHSVVYSSIADKFRIVFTVTSFPILFFSVLICTLVCTNKKRDKDIPNE